MHVPTVRLASVLAGALLLTATAVAAQTPEACVGAPAGARLRLEVTHVRAAQGKMVITVYPDDASRWLAHNGKLARVRVPARAPVTDGCFELPGPGRYAVAVYHDSNGNDRFDRTLVGLPAEGYGFSNDVPTPTGLPPFEKVRFTVKPGETTVRIALRYPR